MNKLIKLNNGNYIIIDDTELVEAIPGEFYFNTYDNHIWKYMPTPCPMPYWGNPSTLRKIIHSSLYLNDDIEIFTVE